MQLIGTHRLVPPRATLTNVEPFWSQFGLTRCIDITDLDRIGIPTYVGVRPNGTLLQVSSGKGITKDHAMCSAVMEALEMYHAENPRDSEFYWASEAELRNCQESRYFLRLVSSQQDYPYRNTPYANNLRIPWVAASELSRDAELRIPAGIAYFIQPSRYNTTTNGLASGNSLEEATLHAIYEVLERASVSGLYDKGRVRITTLGRMIDTSSFTSDIVVELIDRIVHADCMVRMIYVPTAFPVHVYIAYILDPNPLSSVSYLHVGYGCHVNQDIAATRALSEAAQSRLIYIHSSREDIYDSLTVQNRNLYPPEAYEFLRDKPPTINWGETKKDPQPDTILIPETLTWLIDIISKKSHKIYRHVVPCDIPNVSVVKVVIPTLEFNQQLF